MIRKKEVGGREGLKVQGKQLTQEKYTFEFPTCGEKHRLYSKNLE